MEFLSRNIFSERDRAKDGIKVRLLEFDYTDIENYKLKILL